MNRKSNRRSVAPTRRPAAPAWAEPLEGRLLFSTYTVTTLGDGAGSVTPNGAGKFNATTLRAAMTAANAASGADTVNFAPALTGTITLGSALPKVSAMTIVGPGASKLAIVRSPSAATGFMILSIDLSTTASVSGLRLSGGTGGLQPNGDNGGGGVVNHGTLTMRNCVISGNRADARDGADRVVSPSTPAQPGGHGRGGGIYNASVATLTLVDCTVSGNAATGGDAGRYDANAAAGGDGRGGGIFNNGGKVTLNRCTLTGNTATGGLAGIAPDASGRGVGGTARGGGIESIAGSTLTATRCTFSNNSAAGGNAAGPARGGGVYNGGTATLRDSTVSGNAATGGAAYYDGAPATGGGVHNAEGAKLTVDACTVSSNTATGGSGGSVGKIDVTLYGDGGPASGGGVYTAGTATILNSTLATNTARGGPGYFYNGSGGGAAGGGVCNESPGTLVLASSTLSGNTARGGDGGGGPDSASDAAYGGGGAAAGGGLTNRNGPAGGSANVTVTNCTFAANAARGGDGYDHGELRQLGGNAGDAVAGAVYNLRSMTLVNCTVSANTAVAGEPGDGIFQAGFGGGGSPGLTFAGGIQNKSDVGAALTLHNTIVVGNSKGDPLAANEIGGTVNAASSNNVIGTAGKGGLVNGVNGNKVGISLAALKLGALASNGGPTKTMALLTGSPAIDAGSDAKALAAKLYADQRGYARPRGTHVDVGAFEVQPTTGGSIAGTFFNDADKDGLKDSGEAALPLWQAYIDRDDDGAYDPGEVTAFSSSTGAYKLLGLSAGTYRVREVRLDGWTRSKPAGAFPLGYYDVTVNLSVNGGAVTGKDFGNYFA